ncbi:MAG TPA: diguanylate cyclase [Halanaerobiales bacterium]|nr:diguanylate cyclase [Halanaerobiales bacterium]
MGVGDGGLSILFATITGSSVFLLVFLYVYIREKTNYLKYWTIFWVINLISFLFIRIFNLYVIYIYINILGTLFLLKGSYQFFNLNFNEKWNYIYGIFYTILTFFIIMNNNIYLFLFYFSSFIYIFNAYIFFKNGKRKICKITSFLSLIFGIIMFLYPALNNLSKFYVIGNYLLGSIGMLFGLGLLGIYHEELQKRLELREKHYKKIFESSPAGMMLIDENGIVIRVNQAHCDFTGYKKQEIEGKSIFETVVPKKYIENAKNNIKKIMKGKSIEYIGESISKTGDKVYIFFKETKVQLPDGRDCILSMQIDYTDYNKQQKKIKYISFHDELTDLYNRSYMEEEMKRLDSKRKLPISIIMIDVNGLKIINDSYGHQKGDEMLKKTAKILRSSIRKEDIVARWAGDEFVILLPETNEKFARKIKERIKKKCNKTDLDKIPISVGVGIAVKENETEDIYDVLNRADKKMYKNKLTESKSAKNKLVKNLLSTLGAKSDETEEHALRLTKMAQRLGEKVGLSDEQLNNLSLLATLHDIGKVTISEKILNKKTDLNKEEWKIIKEHPKMGYRIASATEEFAPVAKYILHHHERWDGTGYPAGLEKKKIPLLSRIITIVDAYDVMTNGRIYKKAMKKENVIKEFKECAGTQFDPDLVELFIEIIKENEMS